MRRVTTLVCTLILAILIESLPASRTGIARAGPGDCPLAFTPAHGSSAVVLIPLGVSLEWDSSGSGVCGQWQAALERASAALESATGGQAALGAVTVADNADGWRSADIQVYAHNSGIPDAPVGGVPASTLEANHGTSDPGPLKVSVPSISAGGVFSFPGGAAIHLGRSWSEFGPRRGRWSDPDGFLTLVHELGHYAFYLYDEYFAYNPGDHAGAGAARPPAWCTRQLFSPALGLLNPLPASANPDRMSLMYWEYVDHAFWDGTQISGSRCTSTRQWQVYGATDWATITEHYPSLHVPEAPVPVAGAPSCPTCVAPPAARWLLNFLPADLSGRVAQGAFTLCGAKPPNPLALTLPCLQADGYLIKNGAGAVLHEGVPYLPVPPGIHSLTATPGEPLPLLRFYPADQLEMLGGTAGDVARVTLSDPANPRAGVVQAVQLLSGRSGRVTPRLLVPDWYDTAQPAVPSIDVQPVLAEGAAALSGLTVTASNTQSTPFTVAYEQGQISATLFEVGQGRQTAATLALAGSIDGGHERYAGNLPLDSNDPILAGSLYLTPAKGEKGTEDPGTASGGAWALASYSLSCNSPTYFLHEYAPGDEGGIDSADGVVNVHLSTEGETPSMCVAFTRQVLPPAIDGVPLGQTYAIHGSTPLPAGTTIALHFDTDQLIGAGINFVGLVRYQLPDEPTQNAPVCLMRNGYSVDRGSGTVSGRGSSASPISQDGLYQAELLTATAAAALPTCL